MTPARVRGGRQRRERPHRRSSRATRPSRASPRADGFGTVETMRRAFHRRVGVSPQDYRHASTDPERKAAHEDRHPALRPLHRPGRRGPVRGALAHPRRAASRARSTSRAPSAPTPAMLGIEADAAFDGSPRSRDRGGARRHRHGRVPRRRAPGRLDPAPHTRPRSGPLRCAPARCSSAPPGVLEGLEATSHWLDIQDLERYGARPTGKRVVEQGKVVTAAGVSSGIDMALVLAAKIAGAEVAQAIQLGIEYDPAAAVRRRLRREGATRDRRAGAGRGGGACLGAGGAPSARGRSDR